MTDREEAEQLLAALRQLANEVIVANYQDAPQPMKSAYIKWLMNNKELLVALKRKKWVIGPWEVGP